MNNELHNLSSFFTKYFIPYKALTQSHCNLPYQYEYWFGTKNFILIVALFGMIVVCINLCTNEAMRRQAAYRLAWDQRIKRDQLQRSDNIIKVTVVWLRHERQNQAFFSSIYPCRNAFNICWETNDSGPRSKRNACPDTWQDGLHIFMAGIPYACPKTYKAGSHTLSPKKLTFT